jgi:Domain of unknown function (DUF1707)
VLKAAFVAGRLTKDELGARVGQALASRTYADLAAVTADLPAGVAAAQPARPAVPERGTWRRSAVGWVACVVIPLALLLSQGFGPAFIIGFFAAMLAAGCLIAAASERKRSRDQLPQGPAPGAGGQASQRAAPSAGAGQLPSADSGQLPPADSGQLPSAGPGQQHAAEAAWSDRAHPRSSGSRSAHQWRHRGHRCTIGYAGS